MLSSTPDTGNTSGNKAKFLPDQTERRQMDQRGKMSTGEGLGTKKS